MNFKLKRLAILVISAITLFAVSCEQVAINDQVSQISEVIDAPQNSVLADAILADQSVVDMIGHIFFEQADNDFVTEYHEYYNNTIVVKYPELATMELDEAEGVMTEVFGTLQLRYEEQIIETLEEGEIYSRCYVHPSYGCGSGRHWCCVFVGQWQGNCFGTWCSGCYVRPCY